MTRPSRPRVKICGLTRAGDVEAALAAGAWALGFVLWPSSPRAVTASQVRALTSGVPAHIARVGVVVNASVAAVRRLQTEAGLTHIQLHGDEDVASFLPLDVDLIKSVSLTNQADVDGAVALPASVTVLVDAHDPVRRGGTGDRADWTRAAQVAARRPIILAGGLRPDNVAEAITKVAPWAVDVSSGVEVAPGEKDVEKIRALFVSVLP